MFSSFPQRSRPVEASSAPGRAQPKRPGARPSGPLRPSPVFGVELGWRQEEGGSSPSPNTPRALQRRARLQAEGMPSLGVPPGFPSPPSTGHGWGHPGGTGDRSSPPEHPQPGAMGAARPKHPQPGWGPPSCLPRARPGAGGAALGACPGGHAGGAGGGWSGKFLWLGEEEEERGEQEGRAIVHRGCIFASLALVAIVRREREGRGGGKKKSKKKKRLKLSR